jgi:acetoin utilization deacetylase AcuC-like enzyme
VSLGFDTYGQDPIGDFALTTRGYHEAGRRVAALGRRLVVLQEGGYYRPALGENARAWLRGAEGREDDPRPALGFGNAGSGR